VGTIWGPAFDGMKSGRKSGGETWGDEDAGLLNLEGGVTGGEECSALARSNTAPPLMPMPCRTFPVNIVLEVSAASSIDLACCITTPTFEGVTM
jgi:hypothetical protein